MALALVWFSAAPVAAEPPASPLVPLTTPGPWAAITGLIGYGGRLWFANWTPFVNHNSADIYSYDPAGGRVRYERHLFSQGAGTPAVSGGRLYWPFEDSRFSTGHGEYMVTDGARWRWRTLPDDEVFHIHAMLAQGGALYAATSAWRAGVQVSTDGGATWRVLYDHPTPPGEVSRITSLATLGGRLHAGLTAWREAAPKLLRRTDTGFAPVPGWSKGRAVTALTAFKGWLYAVNATNGGRALWRSDGRRSARVAGLDGRFVRALAAGAGTLWAVDARDNALLASDDGIAWREVQRFGDAQPLDVAVYGGRVYVGTYSRDGRGMLWGPPPPAPVEDAATAPLAPLPAPSSKSLDETLATLDRLLRDPAAYAAHARALRRPIKALAMAGQGQALAQRLAAATAPGEVEMIGGAITPSRRAIARWYLLRGIAETGSNGGGRVPPALLALPWDRPANSSEKYLHPTPAAAWAVAMTGQNDAKTLAALIARLDRKGDPPWLLGDIVGALSALADQRFGYDRDAWRRWWRARASTP